MAHLVTSILYTETLWLTKKVCKWVSATKEFPEDIIWVAECELFVEVISIVKVAPWNIMTTKIDVNCVHQPKNKSKPITICTYKIQVSVTVYFHLLGHLHLFHSTSATLLLNYPTVNSVGTGCRPPNLMGHWNHIWCIWHPFQTVLLATEIIFKAYTKPALCFGLICYFANPSGKLKRALNDSKSNSGRIRETWTNNEQWDHF